MNLPNFICVGAQKAGTTTLYNLLNQHPDICFPKEKETHFFINGEDKYSQGITWYSDRFFKHCQKDKLIGEISPGYIYMDYVPERIHKDLGADTKLIFMLRNPVDRAYSNYLMAQRRAEENLGFANAIRKEKERISKNESSQIRFSYAHRGLYSQQIERYLQYFPIENMFFIIFETDLIQSTDKTMQKLCDFLEVPHFAFNTGIKSNPARKAKSKTVMRLIYSDEYLSVRKALKRFLPSKRLREKLKFRLSNINSKVIDKKTPMDTETGKWLESFFHDDILKLQKLINRDLSRWLPSNPAEKDQK